VVNLSRLTVRLCGLRLRRPCMLRRRAICIMCRLKEGLRGAGFTRLRRTLAQVKARTPYGPWGEELSKPRHQASPTVCWREDVKISQEVSSPACLDEDLWRHTGEARHDLHPLLWIWPGCPWQSACGKVPGADF
jgi:hypothetical protein